MLESKAQMSRLVEAACTPDPNDRRIVGTARFERMVHVTRDAQILERAAPILGELLTEPEGARPLAAQRFLPYPARPGSILRSVSSRHTK